MSLIGDRCGPGCGCKCKHDRDPGPPVTYSNEAFDRHQSRAIARCKRLGHRHYGYCKESLYATEARRA